MKKSQVTIFIVFGIFIIIVIGLFFVFKTEIMDLGREKIDPEVEPIYNFVFGCIEEVSEDAIYAIGESGGYFYIPEPSTESGIAYYYFNKENYMPTKEQVQEEISAYIKMFLGVCINDFTDFSEYNINSDEIIVESQIVPGKVVVDAEFPITINKGDKSYFFKNFREIIVPVRLNTILDVAENITLDHMEHDNICMTCLIDLSVENELYIELMDYDENTEIFYIRDEKLKINEEDYVFNFASRFE